AVVNRERLRTLERGRDLVLGPERMDDVEDQAESDSEILGERNGATGRHELTNLLLREARSDEDPGERFGRGLESRAIETGNGHDGVDLQEVRGAERQLQEEQPGAVAVVGNRTKLERVGHSRLSAEGWT